MMIHLEMKFRPTLKTTSGEMKVYRMTPKGSITISWPVNLCLTLAQSLKNFPGSSRVNAPLAKQTSKKTFKMFISGILIVDAILLIWLEVVGTNDLSDYMQFSHIIVDS